jgi:3-oxoacyl-[acyl-carrier protein] reductase
VIVNYVTNRAAADDVVAAIRADGGHAESIQADVADPKQLRSLFDAAEQQFSGLDILVHNAGIARFSSIAQATDEDFDVLFSTNTRSTFVALREAAHRLRDGGRVVVISSAVTAVHPVRSGVYAASKAAGEELARVLAQELGSRRITVNNVLPGATRTDGFRAQPLQSPEEIAAVTPLGRIAEPDDIAGIVTFLLSDAGRWVTGQTIHAGGGLF